MWLVAVPFGIGPFPEDAPYATAADILQLGDGLLDLFAGALEGGAHQKELNCVAREALTLTHLVTQMEGRTPPGPKGVLDHLHVVGDFDVGKGHDRKPKRFSPS